METARTTLARSRSALEHELCRIDKAQGMLQTTRDRSRTALFRNLIRCLAEQIELHRRRVAEAEAERAAMAVVGDIWFSENLVYRDAFEAEDAPVTAASGATLSETTQAAIADMNIDLPQPVEDDEFSVEERRRIRDLEDAIDRQREAALGVRGAAFDAALSMLDRLEALLKDAKMSASAARAARRREREARAQEPVRVVGIERTRFGIALGRVEDWPDADVYVRVTARIEHALRHELQNSGRAARVWIEMLLSPGDAAGGSGAELVQLLSLAIAADEVQRSGVRSDGWLRTRILLLHQEGDGDRR